MISPEDAKTDEPVTLYLYDRARIDRSLSGAGFVLLRSLLVPLHMDREKTRGMVGMCYVAEKTAFAPMTADRVTGAGGLR